MLFGKLAFRRLGCMFVASPGAVRSNLPTEAEETCARFTASRKPSSVRQGRF